MGPICQWQYQNTKASKTHRFLWKHFYTLDAQSLNRRLLLAKSLSKDGGCRATVDRYHDGNESFDPEGYGWNRSTLNHDDTKQILIYVDNSCIVSPERHGISDRLPVIGLFIQQLVRAKNKYNIHIMYFILSYRASANIFVQFNSYKV